MKAQRMVVKAGHLERMKKDVHETRSILSYHHQWHQDVFLRVSWTAKKSNEWVLNQAAVRKELLDY